MNVRIKRMGRVPEVVLYEWCEGFVLRQELEEELYDEVLLDGTARVRFWLETAWYGYDDLYEPTTGVEDLLDVVLKCGVAKFVLE